MKANKNIKSLSKYTKENTILAEETDKENEKKEEKQVFVHY